MIFNFRYKWYQLNAVDVLHTSIIYNGLIFSVNFDLMELNLLTYIYLFIIRITSTITPNYNMGQDWNSVLCLSLMFIRFVWNRKYILSTIRACGKPYN